jgi:hypothetical protein
MPADVRALERGHSRGIRAGATAHNSVHYPDSQANSRNLSCHPLSTSFDNYFMLIAVDRGEEFGSHAAIGTNATWRSIF